MIFNFDSSSRKRFVFLVLSILSGLLDYIICDFVAWINHLPLFCDTIFIMALSFLAGPWWGVLAGFFYHLIDFALNRTLEPGHLFMLCHFLAALTAGYFKIWFIKKTDTGRAVFGKLIALSIALCLVMSVSGGIISYILSFVEAYNQAPASDSRTPSCKLCGPAYLHIRRLGRFPGRGKDSGCFWKIINFHTNPLRYAIGYFIISLSRISPSMAHP